MMGRRSIQIGLPGRRPGLALRAGLLSLLVLVSVRCADDPATGPGLLSGGVTIELTVVDGPLAPAFAGRAPAGSPAVLPCDPPPSGFPEDVVVEVVLETGDVAVSTHRFDIPARSGPQALVVTGVAPRASYVAEVAVIGQTGRLFEGTSAPFEVRSGGRTLASVDLFPLGRRAVLALGAAEARGDTVLVPVMLSQSLPVRGLEFELCFDPEVVEPVGGSAIGSRVDDYRGAAGEPGDPGILRAVLWSPDAAARIDGGRDQVLELRFLFRVPPGSASSLVFLSALVTDAAENEPFTVYFLDGQVEP